MSRKKTSANDSSGDAPQLDLWNAEPELPQLLTPEKLDSLLQDWVTAGWLRPLDLAFSRFIEENASQADADAPDRTTVMLLSALLSHQVGRGHVCLDLDQLLGDPETTLALPPEGYDERSPELGLVLPSSLFEGRSTDELRSALISSSAVAEDIGASRPLVLDGSRLYLHRYRAYEQRIAAGILNRLQLPTELSDADSPAGKILSQALSVLFGTGPEPDYQKLACALAARSRFAVITGGPGTGKTTTVVRLLAAMQSVAERPLRIRLAAPTGKAAARLSESISGAVADLPLSELPGTPAADSIPGRVTTLHRLLGSLPGSRRFRHNPDNPLPLDLLVIDEASMVDVDLMASVFDALPAGARLILLGDKDQLASVDAGAVLGELCQRAALGHYREDTAHWLRAVTGYELPESYMDQDGNRLDQAVAMLRRSYRFDGGSGIGLLAGAVNENRLSRELIDTCKKSGFEDVAWLKVSAPGPEQHDAELLDHCLDGSPARFRNEGKGRVINDRPVPPPVGYRHYLTLMAEGAATADASAQARDQWARVILDAFGQFQVLCALRRGPLGVEGMNQAIAGALRQAGLIDRDEGWYAGRPVLVTGNDYNLGLMNGDIGITLPVSANGETVLRVAFPASDGSNDIRWISPSRLQSVETVFAMTVHKSQGSEFGHTCLVIPDRLTPVLTRELIYTGITRARHWLSLVVTDDRVLQQAVRRGVIRASGLAPALGA
ncbi:exodeoxyribonuclease V subunit alpha [uncultured Marinobacter sp.]|uniref:exodeoxyribonuclease V subunit alpha n=1 Tax=uncultured Marinobacter sp. TaxID=187379 RepID=UPI0030D7D983